MSEKENQVETNEEKEDWESVTEQQNQELEYYRKEIEIAKLKKELKALKEDSTSDK